MSRYRLKIDGILSTITFASKTDEHHLPAALASMIAKYTRELYMLRFNHYFRSQISELKPTAGYVQDGRRFLKEIEPLLKKNGIKQELLVRSSWNMIDFPFFSYKMQGLPLFLRLPHLVDGVTWSQSQYRGAAEGVYRCKKMKKRPSRTDWTRNGTLRKVWAHSEMLFPTISVSNK